MKSHLFRIGWLLLQMCIVIAMVDSAMAQPDYPNRPIKMIVSASPGGNTDLLARAVSERLAEALKQPVIVENRSSALGVVAAEATMVAAPDGYTLLATWHTHTISVAMNPKLSYHPVESFTPITQFTSAGLMLLVNSSAPPKNLKEFANWAKNSGTPLNFGSSGNGSGGHLAGELYKKMAGVKGQHIPYKGTGPAITDLLAGRYDFTFGALQGAPVNMVRAGKLRAIAVTTTTRLSAWPDIPAVAEVLPGFEVIGWYGLIGPAKLPRPIVARLNEEVRKALEYPSVSERIAADGAVSVGNSPEEFRQFLHADLNKWSKLVAEIGAKLD